MKVEFNRALWQQFGDKEIENLPKAEEQVFGSLGPWYGYRGMTIPAWKDAAFNTSQEKLVPIIWNHGFFSQNGAY